jgi:hypothetical protein
VNLESALRQVFCQAQRALHTNPADRREQV